MNNSCSHPIKNVRRPIGRDLFCDPLTARLHLSERPEAKPLCLCASVRNPKTRLSQRRKGTEMDPSKPNANVEHFDEQFVLPSHQKCSPPHRPRSLLRSSNCSTSLIGAARGKTSVPLCLCEKPKKQGFHKGAKARRWIHQSQMPTYSTSMNNSCSHPIKNVRRPIGRDLFCDPLTARLHLSERPEAKPLCLRASVRNPKNEALTKAQRHGDGSIQAKCQRRTTRRIRRAPIRKAYSPPKRIRSPPHFSTAKTNLSVRPVAKPLCLRASVRNPKNKALTKAQRHGDRSIKAKCQRRTTRRIRRAPFLKAYSPPKLTRSPPHFSTAKANLSVRPVAKPLCLCASVRNPKNKALTKAQWH